MSEYTIVNADIVTSDGIIKDSSLYVKDGIIEDIGGIRQGELIDAEGQTLGPGLIDMHIHGAGGYYCDKDNLDESLNGMARFLEEHGITSFQLASCMDMQLLERYDALLKESEYLERHIAGLYFEGPFINPEKKGGLPLESISACDVQYLEKILSYKRVRTMTVAPELEGAYQIIRKLKDSGVTAAFGHSQAGYTDVVGYLEGHITHLYNAQRELDHKKAGLALLPFMNRNVTYELICDTVHVDSDMIDFTISTLGTDRMCLISDGMSFCGLGEGKGKYLGKDIYSDGRACYYSDNNVLIGSGCLITDTGARLYRRGIITKPQFFQIASTNPARVIGLKDRGSICKGNRADLVLADRELNITRVFKA